MFKIDSHIPIPSQGALRKPRPTCRENDPLTAERARELLDYSPETGELRWKAGTWKGRKAGTIGSKGYVTVQIDGRTYLAHRVAWLIMHGRWPAVVIDHINRVPSDNRLCNLRERTLAENAQNTALRANQQSGLPGVIKRAGRWAAQVWEGGWPRIVGEFDDKHEAHRAYLAEKARIHPMFNPNAEAFA